MTAQGTLRKDILTTRHLDKHTACLHSTENIIYFFWYANCPCGQDGNSFHTKKVLERRTLSFSYAAVAPSIWRLDDHVLFDKPECYTQLTLHILHCTARNNLSFLFHQKSTTWCFKYWGRLQAYFVTHKSFVRLDLSFTGSKMAVGCNIQWQPFGVFAPFVIMNLYRHFGGTWLNLVHRTEPNTATGNMKAARSSKTWK